jgi:probable phosphoglycerate mutase
LAWKPPRAAPGTRVLFVRHGFVHNPTGVIYGRMPRFGLSRQGREDVERAARWLEQVPIGAIYTSPLLRARQTAEIIGAAHPGVPIRQTALLIEVRTSWQGESFKEAQESMEAFTYYNPPRGEGDETIEDVFQRMDRALRQAARRHPGQTVVCVSHGDPIKILGVPYSGKELNFESVLAPDPPEASIAVIHFREEGAWPEIDLWIPRPLIRPRIQRPQPTPVAEPAVAGTPRPEAGSSAGR